MKDLFVDLHVHTNSSDSTFSPAEIVKIAREEGFAALGITDHDSVAALATMPALGEKVGLEIVPGVELSAEMDGEEIHLLGYFISWQENWFREKLAELTRAREERAREIVRRLTTLGLDLSFEAVKELSGEASIGRLHIARALVSAGYVKNAGEAFRLYLGEGKPAYVKKFPLTPSEALEIVKSLKGLSSLAHPGLLRNDKLTLDIIKLGVDGLEVYHSDHNNTTAKNLLELCQRHKLLVTGGSDCHGLGKGKRLLGKVKLPYVYLTALKEKKPAQTLDSAISI
jgi:predicted metal-dependent phosphoesterase TrpH